jgi:hypothetical protein
VIVSDDRRQREVDWKGIDERPSDAAVTAMDADGGRRPRAPRNYLLPAERRRLFWRVMPAAAVLMLLMGWIERTWSPRQGGRPQVDTRLEQVAGPRPRGDEVLIERGAEAIEPEPAVELGASPESLARVRDATFFREADNDAWFQTWSTLQRTGAAGLRSALAREVSFSELFGQPRAFRGRLVRMRGKLHRLERLAAPANQHAVDHYWQGWMEPAGGPASPVVVQCLTLPDGMPSGMKIDEPVDITGYFFKNYAYNASDTIRVAPVIMTFQPLWRPRPPRSAGTFAGRGEGMLLVAGAVATLLAAMGCGMWAARRRSRAGRGSTRPGGVRAVRDIGPLVVVVVAFVTASAAALARGAEPGMSLESFLASKGIARHDRAVLVEPGPWTDDKQRMLVRVMARMAAPPALVDSWRSDAEPVAAAGTSPAIEDRFVRIRGRATFVAPWELPPGIAELAGRSTFDLVRVVDERGAVVDVVTPRAARAWKRWNPIDEPATVIGLPLTPGSAPQPVAPGAVAPWPPPPPDLVVAALDVEWHPPTPLGRLGMDYGLFDDVVDDRRLEPGDADAFWAAMAAVRRATPAGIARAAGGTTDVIQLIDPSRKWFARHRGEPVVIEGVARRATRIAVEPDRRGGAGDHYWELVVFVDTPPLQVDGRIQDRYPVVCCVPSLPAGMPSGEGISERVRVPGFAFKRYSYPLQDALVSSSQGDVEIKGERRSTPLVIGPGVEWSPPPTPAGLSNLLFGVFAAVLGGLTALAVYATWFARREAVRRRRLRRETMPDRLELPGE